MMTTEQYTELRDGAIRSLEIYIETGIEGFKVKAIDRLKIMGICTDRCEDDPQHLLQHITS